jgi:AcrR family transcriptional regulator
MSSPRKPPRRGPPRKGEPSARERILQTASTLFYREGIRAIGIDTVIAESGVSKASLYRSFESKDELVAAFMAERDRRFWSWWDDLEEQHQGDPRALLLALFQGVGRQVADAAFRGCPFLNMATEFPDPAHPGRVIARANKEEMRARLAKLCRRLGIASPESVARQLVLLINGAYATGQMMRDPPDADLRKNLVQAAQRLTT